MIKEEAVWEILRRLIAKESVTTNSMASIKKVDELKKHFKSELSPLLKVVNDTFSYLDKKYPGEVNSVVGLTENDMTHFETLDDVWLFIVISINHNESEFCNQN